MRHKGKTDARYRDQINRRRRERYRTDDAVRRRRIASGSARKRADELAERDGGWFCAYCHEPLNGTYHVDHVYPASKGGSDNLENLVLACPPCNWSKNDQVISQ